MAIFSPTFNPQSWVPPQAAGPGRYRPAQKAEAERHNAEIDPGQIGEVQNEQPAASDRHRNVRNQAATVPEAIRADVKAAVETAGREAQRGSKVSGRKIRGRPSRSRDREVAAHYDGR